MKSFVLVGGTSLALQLGHRKSIDIDLFTTQYFDVQELRYFLENHFTSKYAHDFKVNQNGMACFINEIKIDLVNWSVPFIEPLLEENGIRYASIQDILAFKLDAVSNCSARKDYIDLYVLLQKFAFKEALSFYQRKFPYNDLQTTLQRFIQVDRADADAMPDCLWTFDWEVIKENLKKQYFDFVADRQKAKTEEMILRD